MTHIKKTAVKPLKQPAKAFIDGKVKFLGNQGKSGAVAIEGWANPATVDRGNEKVDPEQWNLDNFLKNPVLLYNHGKDENYGMLPIGSVTDLTTSDQGLYAKAVLSTSDDPKIKVIRDLVSEGMLRTFSVGFNPGPESQGSDGTINVGGGELMELSIVTIPMHQDALFSVSSKDYAGMKKKMTEAALKTKGAWVASALENRIGQQVQEVPDFDRDHAMSQIATMANCTMADVKNVLSGETIDVPAKLLSSFADVLELDLAELKKLNSGDVEMDKTKPNEGAQQSGANSKASLPPLRSDSPVTWATDVEQAPKPVENIPDANDLPPPTSGPGVVTEDGKAAAPSTSNTGKVQAIMVPKENMSSDDASQMVSDHGWDNSQMTDDDEGGNYVFVQADPGDFDMNTMGLLDLGNGCMAQVGVPQQNDGIAPPPKDQHPTPPTPPAQDDKPDPNAPPAPPKPSQDDKPDPSNPKKPPFPPKKKDVGSAEVAASQAPIGPGTPVPNPTPTDGQPLPKVDPGHAPCAACIAKHMKDGLAAGHNHDDNKAIALAKCKEQCPTEKSEDMGDTKPYSSGQLDGFADGWQTAHDQIKAGAVSSMASPEKSADPLKTKQAGQMPGPSSAIPGGGAPETDAGLGDNPFLDAARQTNVLLGTLISAMNVISQKLDGLASPQQSSDVDNQVIDGVAKSLDINQNILNAAIKELKEMKSKALGA